MGWVWLRLLALTVRGFALGQPLGSLLEMTINAFDDDDDEPTNVVYEGDNVIVNGEPARQR